MFHTNPSDTAKIPRQPFAEERSKTPKTNLSLRSTERTSKSLVRKEDRAGSFCVPVTKMEAIKEWNGGRCYYLGKGNNHEAVRRALQLRSGVCEISGGENVFLKWTQNSFGFKFHQLGKECLCFNHFEFHRELTNKQRLVWNMVAFCESNKLNAFNYLPTTFIIDLTTG